MGLFKIFGGRKTGYGTQKTHILRNDEFICSVCRRSSRTPAKICPYCKSSMTAKRPKYDPTWVDEIELLDELFGKK